MFVRRKFAACLLLFLTNMLAPTYHNAARRYFHAIPSILAGAKARRKTPLGAPAFPTVAGLCHVDMQHFTLGLLGMRLNMMPRIA